MKYAGINFNDFSAAPGVSLTVFTQGCPHRCEGCHNPETWDFNGGKEFTAETLNEIIKGLTANGVYRNFCILGGEPLCPENEFLTSFLVKTVRDKLPKTKIYIWTGYTYKYLLESRQTPHMKYILNNIDCLIDGPYIESKRDITLHMRGSSNQNIIYFDREENI